MRFYSDQDEYVDAGRRYSAITDQFVMEPRGLTQLRHKVAGVSHEKPHFPTQPSICRTGAAMIRKLTSTAILVALVATPVFAQKQRSRVLMHQAISMR
jgi:hypothetical protein